VQYPGNEEFISENSLAGVLPPGSTVPQLEAGVHPETGVQPETARRSEAYSAD
jgi:hypothetical protein